MSAKWGFVMVGIICFIFGVMVGSPGSDDFVEPERGGAKLATSNDASYSEKDFAVDLRIKEQECFGTAGCNLQLGVHPRYVGPEKKRPDGAWEVTYSVSGSDKGPMIQTIVVDGTQMTFDDTLSFSTASGSVVPAAEVTSVRKAG